MPNKRHIISTELPYHVSARCINREWFDRNLEDIWPIMTNYLYFITRAYNVRILSFVLMSNHFHMLIQTPDGNLSEAMAYFMRETSREIARLTKRINHVYGSRFHRTLIDSPHYYYCAYKYIYRNPVEAGICKKPEEYRFSTLRGLLGFEHLLIPLAEDPMLFDPNLEQTIRWLNTPPNPQSYKDVKAALRKSTFKLPRTPGRNRENPLNYRLY